MRLWAFIAAVSAWGTSAGAQPPTTRVLDCTTSGCHAKEMDHKFLHGPTAVQACEACHEYKDPARHSFELKRQGKDLCAFCHIDKSGTEAPVVHAPVAKGDCTSCHDPHGSNVRRLLKRDTVPALCSTCHGDVLKGSHVHKPATEDCTSCHKAHTSDHAKLLIAEKRDLCISCHKEVGKTASESPHQHKPLEGDCLQCHNAHSSEQPKILRAPTADLCTSCHQDVAKTVSAAGHPHSAVTDGKSCVNCHAPHGSDHARLLSRDAVSTCLECHKKPIVVSKERTVAAVADIADPKLSKHGPIQKDDCAACHGVHGADQPKLLIANYSQEFYQTYSDEAYALCFKCHDRSLAIEPTLDKQTGFRDGSRNLHYVHISKSPQGRSCRACHAVHAAKCEQQIAETVTFGQWKLPINFKPTATGGSCAPGCHKPEAYDRKSAVKPLPAASAPTPAGSAGPAPAPAIK
jgi:predicted CXXCH cytochrome family protein